MAALASQTSVKLLNGTNYPTWKIQAQMALMKDGLWGIVNRSETRPPDTETEKLAKFNKQWDRALAIIVLAIDPSLLYLIGDPTSPIDVWQKLQDQFQKKTWANKLHLRRKLYSLRLKEGESVHEHIRIMTETFNALSFIGDTISDEDRVVHLLASLPESYNMLVTALEACADVPKLELVTERLLHEERKLLDDESGQAWGGEKLMVAKRQNYKGPKCYKCHQFGHIKNDCPGREENRKGKAKYTNRTRENSTHTRLTQQRLNLRWEVTRIVTVLG